MRGKKISSASEYYIFIFLIIILFYSHSGFAQCTNANPTGELSQTFCKSDNSTVENLVASGGTIVWFDSITGGNQYDSSAPLVDNTTYYADDINDNNCSPNRLAVLVSIYGEPPSNVDVFVGKCAIDNPTISDLSATGLNIAWYDAQNGGNLFSPSDLLVDESTYWVQQTENGCTSERLPTTVTMVNPPPPNVNQDQTFCSSSNPTIADLKATEPNITWYEYETSTEPLDLNLPLINGKDYWASQTTFPCEGTLRSLTNVIIDISPNAGTDGTYSECETNLKTTNLFELLGGTPDNSGIWTGPSDLSGGYLGTFDPITNTAGSYMYTVSSTLEFCSDDTANVNVIISTTPPPTTIDTIQTFCEIDNPTVANLNATGENIIWYATETSTTPLNLDAVLLNGEDYWAVQTDANGCSSGSRLMVTAAIISTSPPTTLESNQTFCEVDNPKVANLSATGENIIWYATETSTTPLNLDAVLLNGEDYWAAQTDANGCSSGSRLMVTAAIILTPPPTTIESNQTFCAIDNPTVANLNATGENIIWYDTETSTSPLNIDAVLLNGEDYWAAQTDVNSCSSATRLVVIASLISTTPPTTSETIQTFCAIDTPTIANLNTTGENIIWYATETSTSPLNIDAVLLNGEDYWAAQKDASGCESVSRLLINVIINNLAKATTTDINQTFCDIDKPTIANLQVSGDSILWFDTETSTTPLNETDALINGEDYWALNYNQTTGCKSSSKLMITATILKVESPTIENTFQVFCASSFPKVSDLQTGGSIVWYASETETAPLNTNDLLINGANYWAAQSDSNGCESAIRVIVNVTLTDAGTPILKSKGNEFCANFNPTLADLNENVSPLNEGIITWYDSYPDGNKLSLTEFLTDSETYYAIESDADGCSSANPLAITVDLNACDQYDITIYDGFSPNGNGINDTFKIENLRELYPDFKVEFYNRWGNLIYTSTISKPDWNGRLNGNDELMPAGVYYFIIYFNKDGKKPIQRRLYLSR
ncbi:MULTISPECIES: gliding motility-associated C-terminal domain-containing protein [Flavobacteriaceae]|uniref:Gliding motility-associated C-terminal domain-containing protein n=2 Tax=Flavobacteriaceae TaxID=49546 RepID=A0A4Y8ARP2_9FLAO|nr:MULTISPECIES: gliding motility-associated C-terminal domain-containing protein [Flavobacteriaceae]TEW73047.1 gliding motility-associated C-terminal domain-containing protein [Gramella jeungdoensis]GGK47465.1 hypothetical protein GCM10007963_14700 [Lutibacter litoralis]